MYEEELPYRGVFPLTYNLRLTYIQLTLKLVLINTLNGDEGFVEIEQAAPSQEGPGDKHKS